MTSRNKGNKALLPNLTVTTSQKIWLENEREKTGHSFAGLIRNMINERMQKEAEEKFEERKAS